LRRKIREIKRNSQEFELDGNTLYHNIMDSFSNARSKQEIINARVNSIVQDTFLKKTKSLNSKIEAVGDNLSSVFTDETINHQDCML
jgi:hypothetical protein